MKRSPGRPAERENVPKRPEKAEDDEEVEEGGVSSFIGHFPVAVARPVLREPPRERVRKKRGARNKKVGLYTISQSSPFLVPLGCNSLKAGTRSNKKGKSGKIYLQPLAK